MLNTQDNVLFIISALGLFEKYYKSVLTISAKEHGYTGFRENSV